MRSMIFLFVVWVPFALIGQENLKDTEPSTKTGLKIEYGPNLGTTHIDTLGVKNFYVHITATITNVDTIPIHLQLAFAKEYDFPGFCGDDKYKVFLLPEELTPDSLTVYNNIVNGQHDFLNDPLKNSTSINKTLNPREYFVVTTGTLTAKPSNCSPVPRAIFFYDEGLYRDCDRPINEKISTDSNLAIGLKLEYYNQRKFIAPEDGCATIPVGQISYPDH